MSFFYHVLYRNLSIIMYIEWARGMNLQYVTIQPGGSSLQYVTIQPGGSSLQYVTFQPVGTWHSLPSWWHSPVTRQTPGMAVCMWSARRQSRVLLDANWPHSVSASVAYRKRSVISACPLQWSRWHLLEQANSNECTTLFKVGVAHL